MGVQIPPRHDIAPTGHGRVPARLGLLFRSGAKAERSKQGCAVDAVGGGQHGHETAGLNECFAILVLVSNVVAATAPELRVMIVARAILGLCIGGVWVFGAGAGLSLVRPAARGRP